MTTTTGLQRSSSHSGTDQGTGLWMWDALIDHGVRYYGLCFWVIGDSTDFKPDDNPIKMSK